MPVISKKPILIPEKVELKQEESFLKIKGPKGEIKRKISPEIRLEIRGNKLFVLSRESFEILPPKIKALLGLYSRILKNDITGVVSCFEKKLEIQGIGFGAQLDSHGNLVLRVGFSHPVIIKKEEGISFSVEKNIITVSGIEKEKVGNLAAKIRKVRPPDVYKGKGIRYLGEKVRKKEGKKVVATGG